MSSYSNLGECLHDNYLESFKSENARISLLKKIYNKNIYAIFIKSREKSFFIRGKNSFYKKFFHFRKKTKLSEIYRKFDVLVFERLSLGIIESILLNQPVIFHYPKSLYKYKNNKYKELIILLKKAKI